MPTHSQSIDSMLQLFEGSGRLLVYNPKASEPIISVIFGNNLIKIHADIYAVNTRRLESLLEKFCVVKSDSPDEPIAWEEDQVELTVSKFGDVREVVMAIVSVCKDEHIFSLEFQKTCKSLREEMKR